VAGPFAISCPAHGPLGTHLRAAIRAGGRCLGHSADTGFDEGLLDWLARADLLVHETNHPPHTPYERLASLPAELRARMRLTHYPDEFDLAASAIEPLRQGRAHEV